MTEDKRRFTGKNGEFVPSVDPGEGLISLQYLDELMEWLFYHENKTREQKIKNINDLEMMAKSRYDELGLNYTPTWSLKF